MKAASSKTSPAPGREISLASTYSEVCHAFEGSSVRTLNNGESIFFVLDDVAKALGYIEQQGAARILDEDELAHAKMLTVGGMQNVVVVTESGLYHLVFKSKKLAAKAFRRWVTQEVLPQIRKTGTFGAQPQRDESHRAPVYRSTLTLEESRLLGVFRGKHPALIYIEPTEEPYIELIKSERLLLEVDNLGVESLAHVVQAIKTQWDGLKKLAGPTGCDGFFRSLSADTIGSVIGTAERLSSAILNGQYRRKSAFGKLSVEE